MEYKKDPVKSEEKKNGIRYEASQVMDSGVVDYFLTTRAIIKDAVENEGGILTTTARGSSSSFVTNKLMGFTTVDRYTSDVPMYPERFITKDRVLAHQLPDIDLNLAAQEPFIKAAKKLLGEHGCYPLIAVSVLKEKAAWQMYASNSGVSPATANQISKYIDDYNKALKHTDDDDKDSIKIKDYIPAEYYDIYMESRNYQSIISGLRVHACACLLLNGDIRREIGLVSAVSETTGKRTICAAMEGGYLDEFGYVKEDFLIVDSVYLTYKFFKALGQPVPTFQELREMVKGDKATWDIYEKGITCCVNQCEKKATINKVMKYKPKTMGELSQFIAGIRPGFASLLNNFLERRPYTTGEEKIDELLEDSAHYMIYQESIMKVLGFLHLPMSETYGVIKSISKKKLKGEKKEHLLAELKSAWLEEFGNLDNFDKVWKVISDAAAYSFNSAHSYSMCGDSLYQAWFKAHHTKLFYEVAIKHYQEKGKKDKVDALIKESIKYFGYKMGDYRFGDDNRTIHIDGKIIYPNISSIKGIGDQVGVTLYELGQKQYDNFYDVLDTLYKNKINKTVAFNLIRIGYFKRYGGVKKLIRLQHLHDLLSGAKEISKQKAEDNHLPTELLLKYGNETAKKYTKLDCKILLKELANQTEDKPSTLAEILLAENEVLGVIKTARPEQNKRDYYISNVEQNKSVTTLYLYEIYSGNVREIKMWNKAYDTSGLDKDMMIHLYSIDRKPKREFTGEVDNKGKRIYADVPGEFEYWMKEFKVI